MTTTAQEHMTEMAKAPSLDTYFTRQSNSDEDLARLIAVFRAERALFVSKGETNRKEQDDE